MDLEKEYKGIENCVYLSDNSVEYFGLVFYGTS